MEPAYGLFSPVLRAPIAPNSPSDSSCEIVEGIYWEIDVGPPLSTLSQPKLPIDGARSDRCDSSSTHPSSGECSRTLPRGRTTDKGTLTDTMVLDEWMSHPRALQKLWLGILQYVYGRIVYTPKIRTVVIQISHGVVVFSNSFASFIRIFQWVTFESNSCSNKFKAHTKHLYTIFAAKLGNLHFHTFFG